MEKTNEEETDVWDKVKWKSHKWSTQKYFFVITTRWVY